jgi:transposase
LVADRKVAQQRLHDQLNALCPGLSAPAGHGRSLPIESPTGQAVLACAAAFVGGPPTVQFLVARVPGRLTKATAEYWMQRWRGCLLPPADAEQRDRRLARDLERYRILRDDIAALDDEIAVLLAATDGQILTPCPASRSCGLPHSPLTVCPSRFPDAEHLYSTTGLAPALYQSTLRRHGRISRQGLAEHRDALMGIAWGLSLHSPSFAERDTELRARGMTPIQARVALARNACRRTYRLLDSQQPFDGERYRQGRLSRGR